MGSSYEECRAECVGIYLYTKPEILKIFGQGSEGQDVMYINWLSLARSGLRGLEMYQKDKKMWGQAHSQARYVIIRVLQEADPEFAKIEKTTGSDGEPDLMFTFDRSKILTVGMKAIGDFLTKLQTYKSTADISAAKEMYDRYSTVDGEFLDFLDIVVARRQPRKMFVQCNTKLDADGSVSLVTYESSHEGLVKSWLDRFENDDKIDTVLYDLWNKDKEFFCTVLVIAITLL
jgi:dipeptidyl-peptidase-3